MKIAFNLIILPDNRLSDSEQSRELAESTYPVRVGDCYLGYSRFLQYTLRQTESLPASRLLSGAERRLLLQTLLRESSMAWPEYLRPQTLTSQLSRLIGEFKSLRLTPQVLARHWDLPSAPREGSESVERYKLIVDTYTAYQELLNTHNLHDREDLGLALLHLLTKEAPHKVLARVFAYQQDEPGTIEFRHWPRFDPLQSELITILGRDKSLKVLADAIPCRVADTVAVRARQEQILSGLLSPEIPKDDGLQLLRCEDPREECRQAVLHCREALSTGTASSACAILIPRDTAYHTHILRELKQQRIPYDMLLSLPLAEEPLSKALIQLLSAAQSIYDLPLGELLREPLLNPIIRGYPKLAERLAEQWRIRGRTASAARWLTLWEALISSSACGLSTEEVTIGGKYLRDWLQRLQSLNECKNVSELSEHLLNMLRLLGWPLRALPQGRGESANLELRNRVEKTWEALQEILGQLPYLVAAFPAEGAGGSKSLLAAYSEALQVMLQESRLQLSLGQRGGVLISDNPQLPGKQFSLMIVTGCSKARFPEEIPYDWLLGEARRSELGLLTRREAMVQQRQLFANLLGTAENLLFTWPKFDDRGAALESSSYLSQIFPSSWQRSSSGASDACLAEQEREPSEANLRAESNRINQSGNSEELNSTASGQQDNLVEYRREIATRMANYRYSASSLQTYLDCPYRFMVEHLLALRETEQVESEFSPLDRGNLYHQLVAELLAPTCSREAPLSELTAPQRQERLDSLLEKIWLRPVTLRLNPALWNLEKRRAHKLLSRWLAWEETREISETIACEWVFGRSAAGLNRCSEADACPHVIYDATGNLSCLRPRRIYPPLQLKSESNQLLLQGTIDRIDRQGKGVRISDYKSGAKVTGIRSMVAQLQELQLPLYALAWQEFNPLLPVEEIAYIFLAAEEQLPPISLQEPLRRVGKNDSETDYSWPAVRQRLVTACFAIDADLRQGIFPALPREKASCRYCSCAGICPKSSGAGEEEEDES